MLFIFTFSGCCGDGVLPTHPGPPTTPAPSPRPGETRRARESPCILAICLALCAHQNREGKHDKQAKPWEPSTPASAAPPSPDLVSTKEHGDDVPEAIRKLEANDNAV